MDMGRGNGRVRCMERITWKFTLPYIKDSQGEFAVWLRKLKQELCINLEQWNGEGDEKQKAPADCQGPGMSGEG